MSASGLVVILNGAPRSGKSAIARAIQESSPDTWVGLGVDTSSQSIPERLRPGIGLRPGGERPDLEEHVVVLYAALYESIAAHARMGLSVVVDVGHHESYSRPLHILADCAKRLAGLPVLWVGVRCPIEVIWQRREATWGQRRAGAGQDLIAAVEAWQREVHAHVPYDVELDTSVHRPSECARIVAARLALGPPGKAFELLAATEPAHRPNGGGPVRVRPSSPNDGPWISALLQRRWSSTIVVSRGRAHRADRLPALVAETPSGRCGLATYCTEGDEIELVTLDAEPPGRGIGSALLTGVINTARASGCRRLWLVTTNDNVEAIRFYLRRGLRLTAIHQGAVDAARRLKPDIPFFGQDGLPIHDEVELGLFLA